VRGYRREADMGDRKARIDELLNYRNLSYDIFEQKSELLLRNKTFLRDCAKLNVYFPLRRRMEQIYYEEMRRGEKKRTAVAPFEVALFARRKALAEFGLKSWPKHEWFY
jgi:hypothetical protein